MALSKPIIGSDFFSEIFFTLASKPLVTASAAALTAAAIALLESNRRASSEIKDRKHGENSNNRNGKKNIRRKNLVDAEFFRKLKKFLKIVIPSWNCPEVGYLLVFSAFLIGRTFLSIKVAEVNSSIVKAIVAMDFKEFLKRLSILALFSIPSSTANSMLRFLSNKLASRYRTRLVHHFNDRYLHQMMYYKVINVDDRIKNPDQALTTTIEDWAKSVSTLYSDITKPLLDMILFSFKLSGLLGFQGPLALFGYYFVSGIIIRLISPRFGKLTARAQRLEGDYRHVHNRLITYAEEIAFYGGHAREKLSIDQSFSAIKGHTSNLIGKKFWMGISDGFLTKYGAVLIGYSILGLPVFGPNASEYLKSTNKDVSTITHDYIRNSSLLISLARAIGRIVASYKDVQKLAGYTSLVSQLSSVLEDLRKGDYQRTMVAPKLLEEKEYRPNSGTVERSGSIAFHEIPIITPNGDILSKPVNLSIEKGMNVMIVGPNGCGKSSLFRILGGLWPMFGGTLERPVQDDLFYIPQKPYLTIGTLRDQVIYPDTTEEFERKFDDSHLEKLLGIVRLKKIVSREGGWDSVREWYDVLSGGEKQRMSMARLFYHRPKFAVLDECTSAVSVDVEGAMYQHCRDEGIALVTVSHRRSLWKYHDYLFQFDEGGGWTFKEMSEEMLEGS